MRIRAATRDDVPLIADLIRELAAYEKLAHEAVADEETLQATLFGAHPGAEVMLAFEAETPVGFAVFCHNFSTFLGVKGLWLEDIFVKPQFRGRGYGKALLLQAARIAHDRGCGRFEWAVLDWNQPAIDIYKKSGAVVRDDWRVAQMDENGINKFLNTK
jgi:GNAT superfamily N-acetyltransferase